jgi:protein-S-isoprenylcysteine O-methyltransferase Ste14
MESTGQQANGTATAGVIARPPLLFLGGLLLGLVFDRLLPLPFGNPALDPVYLTAGGLVILLGLAVFVAGIRSLSQAATPVPTNQPTRVLVTTGIHGWTRNPIYLGMFLVYAGIGIAARSPWTLLLTLPPGNHDPPGVVARGVPNGASAMTYRDYKARARRWL